jgi:hypothetical protein
MSGPAPTAEAVTALLIRTRWLVTVVVGGPSIIIAVSFFVLASAPGWFGVGLIATASVAVLVRAQQGGFGNEFTVLGGCALTGLFATVMALSASLAGMGAVAVAALVVAGLGLVGGGWVAVALSRDSRPVSMATEDGPVAMPTRSDRHRASDVAGTVCTVASVPMLLGVFDVYAELLTAGRHIIG